MGARLGIDLAGARKQLGSTVKTSRFQWEHEMSTNKPQVNGFFDERTSSIQYVIAGQARRVDAFEGS